MFSLLPKQKFTFPVMGTVASLTLRSQADLTPAVLEVETILKTFERVFTPFDAASLLRKMWASEKEVESFYKYSPLIERVHVLTMAAEDMTGGAFTSFLPLPGEKTNFKWNPTGLVKALAIADATIKLKEDNIEFSLNVGGDILCNGAGWKFGIVDASDSQTLKTIVELDSGGMATSGCSERGAHLWDPFKMEWVERVGSATVWGSNILIADIWATAIFVNPALQETIASDFKVFIQ